MARLLQESGSAILQESGSNILLDFFVTAQVAAFNPDASAVSLVHPIYPSPAVFNLTVRASWSLTQSSQSTIQFVRNPALDILFNCAHAVRGVAQGIAVFNPTAQGFVQHWVEHATPALFATSAFGYHVIGLLATETTAIFGLTAKGTVHLIPTSDCWVWTSRIGAMNFNDDQSGQITKRPMSWSGFVYQIKKLGGFAIVYGNNGITLMAPHGVDWEVKDLWPIGIYGKNAVADVGSDSEMRRHCHHAIDGKGMLLIITEGGKIEAIDYSVYFAKMNHDLVMSYDPLNDLIYICDGTIGYIFSRDGLGEGPANVTGIGYKNDDLYVAAPGPVTFDAFNICTNILDFGNRGQKTITGVDLGIEATVDVFVAIDFRWDKAQNWITSPWVKADKFGHASPYVSGIEFRIRVKLANYEWVQLDYINVEGVMSDTVQKGDKTLQKLAQLVAA